MRSTNRVGLAIARGVVQSGAMKNGMRHRVALVLAYIAVVLVLASAVWRYGYVQGLDQLEARGQADLALAGDRLVGQLQRYRDLAVLMADHPQIKAELDGNGGTDTAALLQEVADKSAALDVAVLDRSGRVVLAAQGDLSRNL